MNENLSTTVGQVRDYWDAHTLGLQYVTDQSIEPGSPEFFAHIRPWMNPYKFPWIMERIDREARLLKGKHLLEIGCGMGYDSLEFLKRGVCVTATDLTPSAVAMTRRHFDIERVHAEDIRTANALELPSAIVNTNGTVVGATVEPGEDAVPGLAAIVYAAMLFGSVQMLRRRRYGWAMAASILALVPCNVFTVFSIGFGVWGILVLRRTQVKAVFR